MKKKFTKQKGITLIALIITIIVMLILVGVTINVALNGGLFDKAKTASEDTQREAIKEQAEVAKVAAYAESIKNNTQFGVSDAVAAIAQELGETAKGTYAEVTTKIGTFYIVVDNELKVTVTQTEPSIKFYNVGFKDLNEVNLLSVFPEEGCYIIAFENIDGIHSGIQVLTENQNRAVCFFPDITDEAFYWYVQDGTGATAIPWTYYLNPSSQSEDGEVKSPEIMEKVTIDYTVGSREGVTGVFDFNLDMINSILDITEVQ